MVEKALAPGHLDGRISTTLDAARCERVRRERGSILPALVPSIALFVAAGVASPVLALDPPSVAEVHAAAGGSAEALLVFTNGGSASEAAPARLPATLTHDGVASGVTLQRAEGAPAMVPAGGSARLRYRFATPAGARGDLLLALDPAGGYRFAAADAASPGTQVAAAAPGIGAPASAASPARPGATPPPVRTGNGLLANLSTYSPIYAVLGAHTNTNARLELGFKYQLLGRPGDGHWYSGFHFAYSQRMFWDTAANSAPFRDVDYQPEFLYIYTLPPNARGDQLSVRGGFLHESNGRSGDASRGYNILYVQPTLNLPIGGWTASIGPRWFQYVIGRDNNPDIARYRGHQALALSIGHEDGLKLSTWSRINFGTGKGAVDADLTYPLTGLWRDLPLYVVVQGFTGYGEALLDYDRRQTRLRVGIGIVR